MKGKRARARKTIKASNAREAAFSKRQSALFKKASELCALYAVEIAIILFSPSGMPFSFGHPSVGAVLDRFENPKAYGNTASQQVQTNGDQILDELSKQYADVLGRLKVAKKRAKELQHVKPLDIDNLSFEQLMVYKMALTDLKEKLDKRRMEIMALEASSSTPSPAAIDASVISQTDEKHGDPCDAKVGEE